MKQINILISIILVVLFTGCITKKDIQEIVVENSIKNEFKVKVSKDKKVFQSISNDLNFINNKIVQHNRNSLLREKLKQVDLLNNFNNILYLQKESTIQLIQVIEKSDQKSKQFIEKIEANFKKHFETNQKELKERYEEVRNATWKMEESLKKQIEELEIKREQTTNVEVKNNITNQIKVIQVSIKDAREINNINTKYYQKNDFYDDSKQINN